MSTWNASFAAIALLVPGVRQDNAKLVDDMIARSNALKSFVATYKLPSRSSDAGGKEFEGVLRLVYRAPEEMLVDFKSEDSRTFSVIAGGRVSVLVEKEGRPVQHGEADLETTLVEERARIIRIFHEKFPALSALDELTSLGAFVNFTWKTGTKSERPEFKFQAGTGRGNAPLLDWLGRLKRSGAQLATEGEDVVWEPDEGFRVLILKDSGFIQKVEVTYGGETKTALELADIALDTDVKDEEFRFAKIDPSEADTSASLATSVGINVLTCLQSSIRRRTREAIEAGTVDWDGDTREGLGAVFRAFHSEFAPVYWAGFVRSARSSVDRHCLRYQEMKRDIPKDEVARDEAAIEEKRIDWEKSFRENMEKVIEEHLSRWVPDTGRADTSKVSGQVRAIELEGAESACRKSVVEPLLEYLQQQMELAGRGELPPAKN